MAFILPEIEQSVVCPRKINIKFILCITVASIMDIFPLIFQKKERMQGAKPASAVLTVVLVYMRSFSYIPYLFFIFMISVPASRRQPSP